MRQARAQRGLEVGHQDRGGDALAGHVAHQHGRFVLREREVVEEVAAHLARGDGGPGHLREREAARLARQQLFLDPPADLELLAQPLLHQQALLVPLEVRRHPVEAGRQAAQLGAARHRHLHVEVTPAQPLGAVGQRGQRLRERSRQREDAQQRDAHGSQAVEEVARRSAADLAQRLAQRLRDADPASRRRCRSPIRPASPCGRSGSPARRPARGRGRARRARPGRPRSGRTAAAPRRRRRGRCPPGGGPRRA